MSFYGNFAGSANIQVEAAQGYDKDYSAMQTLVECHQNELAMFTAFIEQDFSETKMVNEGASVDEVTAMQEGAIGSFFTKLKELFTKLWSKIKAIFHGFIAKFDATFMKSSKAFAKKYRQEILTKDLGDATVKYSKPKAGRKDFVIEARIEISAGVGATASNISKALEDFDAEETESTYLRDLTGVDCDPGDFEKEYHEAMYEDEDEVEIKEVINDCLNVLNGQDDLVKKVKKANDVLEKQIQNIIKEINKMDSEFGKSINNAEGKYGEVNKAVYTNAGEKNAQRSPISTSTQYPGEAKGDTAIQTRQKIINLMSKRAAACQRAITKVTAGTIREAKFQGTQARRVVAKAVAAKDVSHESAFMWAAEQAAAYEAELELA